MVMVTCFSYYSFMCSHSTYIRSHSRMLYTGIFTLTHMNSLGKLKPKFVYHWTLEIMITASFTVSQQRMSNIIIYLQYF